MKTDRQNATARRAPGLTPLAAAVFSAALLAPCAAEASEAAAAPEPQASPVVVTATRTAKALDEAPSSVSLVASEDIDRNQYGTIGEVFEDIPNVDVEGASNPAYTKISVRGSDPWQVTYLIDGVRQDYYTTGGNRPGFIFVDPELVKQVEVRHGGGSSLYGNGGIGGTVAVTTKSASDLLRPGQSFGAILKTGYTDASREWSKSAYLYGKAGIADALFAYTRRDGGKLSTSRTGRRSASPRDSQYDAILAKVTLTPTENNKLSLSYTYDRPEQWSGPEDDRDRYDLKQHRAAASWDFRSGDLVNLKANVQYTRMENSFENPFTGFEDKFESVGGNLQNTSVVELAGTHALTYGLDLSQTRQKAKNPDGSADLTHPKSRGSDSGLFIQDEYSPAAWLTVTPVLRWSHYDRKPQTTDNEKYGLRSQSDSKVTPGITFTLSPADSLSFYLSAQSGYRPPFLDELYTSMDYADWGLHTVVLPNSSLKPEESLNLEAGMNAEAKALFSDSDRLALRASVFRDRVKNLIQASYEDMDFTEDGMIQYVKIENVSKALKTGAELQADYWIGDFDFHASYGYLHAKDQSTGETIPGVTPQKAVLRAGYTYHPWNLNAWYALRAYKGGKSSTETAYGSGEYQRRAGFATHSVGFAWTPKVKDFADFSLNFAIDNLGNKQYRHLNGGYGTARAFRTWLTARF